MDQAWLDSLSEDWVSQPRSAGSPVPSLPSLSNSTSSNNRVSRIPTIAPTKQTVSTSPESPLNERSTNGNNIPLSQRGLRRPSKLKEELSNSTRGRDPNRRLSASSTQSVIYNTVQHKSHSLSPTKSVHETPEWKKRLLQGDVAYGEQRDLFSPAGLENIFRPPPPPQPMYPSKRGPNIEDGSIMPSSPPAFHVKFARPESTKSSPNNEQEQNEERRQPRSMNYRLADDGSSGFSENDISQSSSFHPKPVAEIPPGSNDQHAASVSNSNMDSSSVQHNEVQGVVQRLVSGQSIMLNEELSPIFISKHNTDDGKIDFAPLDVSAAELQKRLEELSVQSRNQAAEGEEGEVSQLLPGDWTTGTDDFAHNGRFVNLRRGGHSQEGSFQKRLLSPSSLPAIDESAMLPEESIQASTPKQLPTIKKTRASDGFPGTLSLELSPSSVPPAPHPSPAKPDNQSTKSGSGSPLKLFGNYDTFTNAKLLRRLSQFEEHYDDNTQEEFTRGISSREMEATHPEINQAFVAPSSPEKMSHEGTAHSPRRMSSFGKGDLDSFQFSEAISYESNDASLQENNENFDADDDKENVSFPVLDSNVQTKFRFQLDPSPSLKESSARQRRSKQISTVNTARRTITLRQIIRPDSLTSGNSDASTIIPTSERQEDLETPRKRNGDSEGKRLQYSPVKDPTPKRRRTLPKDEFTNGNVGKENFEGDSVRDTHQQMQNVIGRKRKDARHENDHQAANPQVLAMRQILRPRTPTPSQRGSVQHERVPLAELTSTERTRLLQQEKIARIQAELDSTNPFKISMQNDSRKGSVTTQDFLDEAKKIMLAIRGKTRPRSGLTSVEESESETDRNASTGTATQEQDEEDEDSYQESTQEPFSRPPSREGRPVPKAAREQQDPGVLDHLRQYEENSDMDDIIAASMRSIAMVKDAANSAEQIDRIVDETIMRTSGSLLQDGEVESDPPNVRITRNPDLPRKRKHSASTASGNGDINHDGDFPSHGSTGSGSTTNSVPTGSSRGSDSRRVIAPHTVSHLIPEQLAGMIFDRERNMWVKRKSISGQGEQNFLPSDDTEEDPFGDIPDLSVDETQELQRIKAVAAKRKEEARIAHDTDRVTSTLPKSPETSMDISPTQVIPTKSKPETNSRLSSWSEDHDVIAKSQSTQNTRHTRITTHEESQTDFIEEVEREISIHEDRVESGSPRRRRNVTISFSSPLASVIQPAVYNDEPTPQPGPAESGSDNESQEDTANSSIILNKRTSNRKVSSTKTRSALRNPSRRLSVGGHTFSARPVSRIDEQDEESTGKEQEDDEHDRSVSIIVTTPAPTRHEVRGASVVLATPRPVSHEIGTLELTPMSEFTMNQPDESFGLEVSYIAKGQRYVPGSGSKKTLSHSIRELVEKLTEVEPFEPFWEHLGKLELKEKKLTSLHKLDEFCEHLEDLDVSKNQIYQLNGAPTTIRHLRISHNCLSDLTAWGHLTNLQYVDISNNEIESLSAFKYQVHLRSLKADNNKIRSLDGIGHLDGLLSLRLRGNLVEAIDFAGTKLQRLNDLDLKNNRVREVRDLQKLTSLQSLNLEDNDLEIFPQIDSVTPWSLKYLKLSGNKLKSLDVSQCPNLRLLYLDRNRLGNVTGFFACKHLDSLSMREQQEDAIIDTGFLSEAFEIRKLFLSGNLLLNFAPQVDYLNLQYLELANCGLDCLPENFGQIFSNVRVLNLNFNALKELSSLAGIVRLKKLHVTGNRLARLRKTAVELHQHSSLKSVDLRNNPISLGFYPTVTEKHLVVPSATQDVDGGTVYDPYTLGDADRARDIKYAACLDMETKMRRRIYEILTNGACRKLKFLDGLKADRTVTGVRDKVWNALVTAGVVTGELVDLSSPRKDRTQTVPKESAGSRRTASEKEKRGAVHPRTPDRSGVWYAEDSFA